ncbi:MAG: 6-phosphogluconolactonase [Acidiferrobacteraceae bacterium]
MTNKGTGVARSGIYACRGDRRRVYPDVKALTSAAARAIVDLAERALRERGRFLWVLSGGSTPEPVYREIACQHAHAIDWRGVHVFWGDERCVAPEDPRSNYGNARKLLFDHVPVPLAGIHRIHGEDGAQRAAADYEREIESMRADANGGVLFDLVLLGLGADGHTASLFPGLHAVHEQSRRVMAEYVSAEQMWRISLTPRLLSDTREVLFLVAGASKAEIVGRIFAPSSATGQDIPAQTICPEQGQVRWFLDKAAAARLGNEPV